MLSYCRIILQAHSPPDEAQTSLKRLYLTEDGMRLLR